MPRILSVAAPANGSGKTSLIVSMLADRPGTFTALKASTVYRDGRHCPRAGTGCACRRLQGEYTVISDKEVLGQPRTDTGRFAGAGAARVLWCLARPGAHETMWQAVTTGILGRDELILAEGSGAIQAMGPDRLVMVASAACPRDRWKESTWPLMERADLVVVNRQGGEEAAGRLAGEIRGHTRARVVMEDVTRPLKDWSDPALAELLAEFAAPGGA